MEIEELTSNIAAHKPHLVWFGQILGMDLYINIQDQRPPYDKVFLAQEIMKKVFNVGAEEAVPTEEKNDE